MGPVPGAARANGNPTLRGGIGVKCVHYTEIDGTVVKSDLARGVTGRVCIGRADGAGHFCMRVFEVAEGGHTPLHTHPWEHEVFVHRGEAEIVMAGAAHRVRAGSVAFIPGGVEHQMRNVGEGPFVFVCLIPSGAPEL